MKSAEDKKNTPEKDNTYVASKEKNQPENMHKKYEDIHFVDTTKPVWNYSLFTEEDISNFQNGTHYSLYKLFGNKQFEVNWILQELILLCGRQMQRRFL